MRLGVDLINIKRKYFRNKAFRSVEDVISFLFCAVDSSSCAGVVRYLSLINHASSEPRHLLWSTIPVEPPGVRPLILSWAEAVIRRSVAWKGSICCCLRQFKHQRILKRYYLLLNSEV